MDAIVKGKTLIELQQELKTLEQLFFKSIEEYRSYEEVYVVFTKMRDIHQQIDNLVSANSNSIDQAG